MELITRRGHAKIVAERWQRTYKGKEWLQTGFFFAAEKIYGRLILLGPDPEPDDVDAIIGNTTWTNIICDECKKYVEIAIIVGQEPDYESNTAQVCKECLEKALALFKEEL